MLIASKKTKQIFKPLFAKQNKLKRKLSADNSKKMMFYLCKYSTKTK